MSSGYLRIKAFHIEFLARWFADRIHLPRMFVELAGSHAERERLLLVARKPY